jgi:SAM-dependent methyltransferase
VPGRQDEVVATVAAVAAAAGARRVGVHGPDAAAFARDVAGALPGVDVLPGEPGDLVVVLETGWDAAPAPGEPDVVVDFRNRSWPVVRHVAAHLRWDDASRRRETQAFFALRAPGWDRRFPADGPAYTAGVAAMEVPAGGVVADVGCGTGRALPALRDAVGPAGWLLAVDLTAEMLEAARERARAARAALVLADGGRLPLADGVLDAVFTAGYLPHVPDPEAALRELARVTRPGGPLALFHPVGRAALAARRGGQALPTDLMAEGPLAAALSSSGWRVSSYEDGPGRFLAVARRVG